MQEFEGRTALVTGAASGMGFAMAACFAREGMNVVLVDVEERALKEAAEKIEAMGVTALAVPTDVGSEAAMDRLGEIVHARFGSPDLLVLNAGRGWRGRTHGRAHDQGLEVDDRREPIRCHPRAARLPRWHARARFRPRRRHGLRRGTHELPRIDPLQRDETCRRHDHGGALQRARRGGLERAGPLPLSGPRLDEYRELGAQSPQGAPERGRGGRGGDSRRVRAFVEKIYADAKPPSEVAELVLAAIVEGRFWIQTDEYFRDAIKARHRSIENDTDPPARGNVLTVYA